MKEKVNHEQRAFFVWTVLADCALKRRTITYKELGEEIGVIGGERVHQKVMRFNLSPIQNYCLENKLPPLSIVAVNQNTGLPGDGFIAWDVEDIPTGIQKVYDYNWRSLDNPFQYAEIGATQIQLMEDIVNSPDSSETVYQKVKVRGVAQQLFRKALLKIYNCSCAFCGLTFEEALDASHIVPYAKSNASQRLDVRNGILLCATHHKLFDGRLLTVSQDYTINFSGLPKKTGKLSQSDELHTVKLHGQKINLPENNKHLPNKCYLAFHQAGLYQQ